MNISTETTANTLLFHVEGRLDAITSSEFEKQVIPLTRELGKNVLMDFAKLDYISSAGLRSLLVLAKELKEKNFTLVLCALNESILEVFHISGFDTIMNICTTMDGGLKQTDF